MTIINVPYPETAMYRYKQLISRKLSLRDYNVTVHRGRIDMKKWDVRLLILIYLLHACWYDQKALDTSG